MPNLVYVYDGSDRTQDTSAVTIVNTGGGIVSDTAQKFTGPRSLKLPTSAGGTNALVDFRSPLADAGRRISIRFRMESLPSTATPNILNINTSANTAVLSVAVNTSGNLVFRNANGTVIATGTAVMAAATWYRITWSFVITNTTTWQVKIYLDGTIDINQTNAATLVRVGADRLQLSTGGNFGASKSTWWDDLYIDDGTDLADPGAYRIPFFSGGITGVGPIF